MIVHIVAFGNNTFKIGTSGEKFENNLEASFVHYPSYKIVYSRVCDKSTARNLESIVLKNVTLIDASSWLLDNKGCPISGSKQKTFTTKNINEVIDLIRMTESCINFFPTGKDSWLGKFENECNYNASHTIVIQDAVRMKKFLTEAVDAVFTEDTVTFKFKGSLKYLFKCKELLRISERNGEFYIGIDNVVYKRPVTKPQLQKIQELIPTKFKTDNIEQYIQSLLDKEFLYKVIFEEYEDHYCMTINPTFIDSPILEAFASGKQINQWVKYFGVLKKEENKTYFYLPSGVSLDSLVKIEYVPFVLSITETGYAFDESGIVIKRTSIPIDKESEIKSKETLYQVLKELENV